MKSVIVCEIGVLVGNSEEWLDRIIKPVKLQVVEALKESGGSSSNVGR